MSGKAEQKNAYYCEACGRYTVTVHRDDGVTPMFLACRAAGDVETCQGRAASTMYRDVDSAPAHVPKEPEWEWVKPKPKRWKRGNRFPKAPKARDLRRDEVLELRKIGAGA